MILRERDISESLWRGVGVVGCREEEEERERFVVIIRGLGFKIK